MGGCEPVVPDRLLVSSEEPFEASGGPWEASVSDAFFVSSIVRSLTLDRCAYMGAKRGHCLILCRDREVMRDDYRLWAELIIGGIQLSTHD